MPLAVAVCGAAARTIVLSLQAAGAAVAVIEAVPYSMFNIVQQANASL